MVRDCALESRTEVLHLHHGDDELRKFVDPWAKRFGLGSKLRIMCQQIAVEDFDHARAGTGRNNDRSSWLKGFEEAPRKLDCGFAKAFIERGLTATEHTPRHVDLEPQPLQHGY